MRTSGQRTDARLNRQRLLAAVGRLLAESGRLTLAELAVEAGVSRSTTYRNFDGPNEAIDAYIADFLTDFEAAVNTSELEDSLLRLHELCNAWGRLVQERSHALVHVRSVEGYLARARREDPIIGRIHGIITRAVATAVADGQLPPVDLDYAAFLWNLLLDPRELLDLAVHRDQSVQQVTEALTADYITILRHTDQHDADH